MEAYQALRGVQFHVAAAAELGDLRRFDKPRQLMAFVGLHPSEDSSGNRHRQGGIAKTGNLYARTALIEGAWSYRYPAKVSRQIQQRQEALAEAIRDISWKAQVRLCKRYRKLIAHGQTPQCHRHCHRAGAGCLHVGDRAAGATAFGCESLRVL